MKRLHRFAARLPITVKVPIVVAILMVAISAAVSERVFSRLTASQERQLDDLANTYLDGLASPLVDSVVRGDPWEIFDILDQAKRSYAAVKPIETIVTDTAGLVLAGSNPRHASIGSLLPADFPSNLDQASKVLVQDSDALAFIERRLQVQGRHLGTLHAAFDISPLLAERREVLLTLVGSNAVLTLVLAALGWFAVRRMVAPMKVLAEHLEAAGDGSVEPIPINRIPAGDTEAGRLFRQFNRMARAVSEREELAARLAEEERLAGLGRLASGMAHEINNPLGGMFNAIDTLKRHGAIAQVRETTIDLLERGLKGIRDVVRAALMTYRADQADRLLKSEDIEDLRLLVSPEARRCRVFVQWKTDLTGEVPLPATAMRQIILNLVLNACQASPQDGVVVATVAQSKGTLLLQVDDQGPGMPVAAGSMLTGSVGIPAPIGNGTGLGLWMTNRLVTEMNGTVSIDRKPAGGTRVSVAIPIREVELSNVA